MLARVLTLQDQNSLQTSFLSKLVQLPKFYGNVLSRMTGWEWECFLLQIHVSPETDVSWWDSNVSHWESIKIMAWQSDQTDYNDYLIILLLFILQLLYNSHDFKPLIRTFENIKFSTKKSVWLKILWWIFIVIYRKMSLKDLGNDISVHSHHGIPTASSRRVHVPRNVSRESLKWF